jgi:hypothetical protein
VRWPQAREYSVGALSQLCDTRQPVRALGEDNVRIRYQETSSEDIEDYECAAVIVIFRMCKPVCL